MSNLSNLQQAYQDFLDIIQGMVRMCIPHKQITVRNTDPWFVTPLVKILLRKRNALYHAGRLTEATDLSTKINRLISEVKSQAFKDIKPNDSKKLWSSLKKMANYETQNKNFLKSLGLDSFEKLEEINRNFVNIATDPDYNSGNIDEIVTQGLLQCTDEQVTPLSEYEIYLTLRRIKKTSPGPDNIPYWVFRECAGEITSVITSLINASLTMGVVPLTWKQALVTPVLKVKKISDFTGFKDLWPISVTSILSRVTERIVVKKTSVAIHGQRPNVRSIWF